MVRARRRGARRDGCRQRTRALRQVPRHLRDLRDGQPGFDDLARAWLALAEAVCGDLLAASELLSVAPDSGDDGPGRDGQASAGSGNGGGSLMNSLGSLTVAYIHLARDEPAAASAALDQCEPDGQSAEHAARSAPPRAR